LNVCYAVPRHAQCDIQHEALTGFEAVTKNMLCATMDSATDTGSSGTSIMDGAPLLVRWTGASTGFIQIGVQMGGPQQSWVRYTRVSEMLQWILSGRGLGIHPAKMLNLKIKELSLPPGGMVTIYNGASESAGRWTLDSNCDAGESYTDGGSGAMLLVVEGNSFEPVGREKERKRD
jgi:hypothetical protein